MATSSSSKRINTSPRLSANQLADYLSATASRRYKIIQDAKHPPPMIVSRYREVRNGLKNFISDLSRSDIIIIESIEKLQKKLNRKSSTPFQKEDAKASIEALEKFSRSYNSLSLLKKYEFRSIDGSLPKLSIEGVDVSVDISVTAHRTDTDGTKRIGGLITVINKSETSSVNRKKRCEMIAVLLYEFLSEHCTHLGDADSKMCMVLDVFEGNLHTCPKTYKRALNNIRASCNEIALRWEQVPPPDNWSNKTAA